MTGDVNIFLALTVSISDRQGTVIFAFGLTYFDAGMAALTRSFNDD